MALRGVSRSLFIPLIARAQAAATSGSTGHSPCSAIVRRSSNTARGGRVQRLAVTDAFPLDREGRKLVIIRRDNVEHLIMIGGPNNDMLIESNIVRGMRGEIAVAGGGARSRGLAAGRSATLPQRPA